MLTLFYLHLNREELVQVGWEWGENVPKYFSWREVLILVNFRLIGFSVMFRRGDSGRNSDGHWGNGW